MRRERNKASAASYRKRRKLRLQEIMRENERLHTEVDRLMGLLESAHEMKASHLKLQLEVEELRDQLNRWVIQAPLLPLPAMKRSESDWDNS